MKNSRKIAIITSEFPPEPGGIGNHALNLAKSFSKEGFNITVLTDQRLEDVNTEADFDTKLPFAVLRTPFIYPRVKLYLQRFIKAFNVVSKNPTIIASGKFSLWTVAILSFFFKRNLVAVIHGSEVNFSNKLLRKSIDISLKRFDSVIAVSNYTKSLVSYLKLKNIKVIPNGFKIEKRFSVVKDRLFGTPSLITVGTVSERKGQQNVIKALPLLLKKFPNIHYHIVGKPNDKDYFMSIAKNLKVNKNITFHGAVSNEKKYTLLSKSDIFVMLSQQTSTGDVEGFGIAILEANSIGVPAIGAKNCGIEDAILDKNSGVLIDNKNANEFNIAISTIMENYVSYSNEAIDWSTKFDWNSIIKEYTKIIQP